MAWLLSRLIIAMLKAYQYCISPCWGYSCRFTPSCSHYAIAAVQVHGVWYGLYLSVLRVTRCHPWHAGGQDGLPEDNKYL